MDVLEKKKNLCFCQDSNSRPFSLYLFAVSYFVWMLRGVFPESGQRFITAPNTASTAHARDNGGYRHFCYGTQDAHRHYGNFHSILKGEISYYSIGGSSCLRTGKEGT